MNDLYIVVQYANIESKDNLLSQIKGDSFVMELKEGTDFNTEDFIESPGTKVFLKEYGYDIEDVTLIFKMGDEYQIIPSDPVVDTPQRLEAIEIQFQEIEKLLQSKK